MTKEEIEQLQKERDEKKNPPADDKKEDEQEPTELEKLQAALAAKDKELADVKTANQKFLADEQARKDADAKRKADELAGKKGKAEENKDWDTLKAVYETEVETLRAQIAEKDRAEKAAAERYLDEQRVKTVIKNLGAQLVDQDLIKLVDLKKMVVEKRNDDGSYEFNSEGLRQTIAEAKKKLGKWAFVQTGSSSSSAAGGSGDKPASTLEERLKKGGYDF